MAGEKKTPKGRAKKNKKTLEQWSKENGITIEFALQEITAGNLALKLSTDKDGLVWVETNKQSLQNWAKDNGFEYSWVQRWHQEDILPVKTITDKEGNIWVQIEEILRSIKLTLQYATKSKKNKVYWLLQAYRAGVNFFIKSLWNQRGKLDKDTLARLQKTRLSERYKSQALKQAIEIVVNTGKAAKVSGIPASCPFFVGGAKLDKKFVAVEDSLTLKDFDISLKLSTLKKMDRITIPTKGTAVLEKWMAVEGAKLVQGCELREDSVIVWVKLPTLPYKSEGTIEALDLGKKKLAVDHLSNHYGKSFDPKKEEGWNEILNKINRRKKGSKGRKEAYAQRENYLNQTLNKMPWDSWRFLGGECLDGIKQGSEKTTKRQRKILTSWNQRRVRDRISHKAQENRVFQVPYDPRNTSRECPTLKGGCGKVSKANRQGESFKCSSCGYKDDADNVGAFNGYVKTCRLLGSLESPKNKGEKESSDDKKSEESGSS